MAKLKAETEVLCMRWRKEALMSRAEACVLLIGPRPTTVPEFLGGGSEKLEDVTMPISGAQGGG